MVFNKEIPEVDLNTSRVVIGFCYVGGTPGAREKQDTIFRVKLMRIKKTRSFGLVDWEKVWRKSVSEITKHFTTSHESYIASLVAPSEEIPKNIPDAGTGPRQYVPSRTWKRIRYSVSRDGNRQR